MLLKYEGCVESLVRRTLHDIRDFPKYGVMDKMNLPPKSQFTFSLPSKGLCNCMTCENHFFFPIYIAVCVVNGK